MTVPMTAITGERISIRAKKARWDRPVSKAIERCRRARMRAAERKAEKEAARMREMAEDTLQAEEIDADSSNETGGATEKSKGRKTKSHRRQKYGNHRWINTITLLFNSLRDKHIFHRQKVPIKR